MRDESNEALMLRFRGGETRAFEVLLQRHQKSIYEFILRSVGAYNTAVAEDLTQDLFLKLMQSCRRYRPEGKLSTFVYRVATNLWIDHYRAARPQARLYSIDNATHGGPIDVAGNGPSPADVAVDDEERQVLRRALESLTEPHRIVFELAVYQERPYGEISELLKIPVGTIKSRMHNAVQALKDMLGRADESASGDDSSGLATGGV